MSARIHFRIPQLKRFWHATDKLRAGASALGFRWSLPHAIALLYPMPVLFLPIAALMACSWTVGGAEFWRIATNPVALAAYNTTFLTALLAAATNGVFGSLVAWVLVRYSFPGKKVVDAAVDLPFALPTSVAGVALATLYSDNGWLGQVFTPFGIKIAFTPLGVFVAMMFISLPFIVRALQPVLQDLEPDVEEAALCLGATRSQIFWRVLLPVLLPAILTGVAQGFSRAVGEYGSVVLIASSIPFSDLVASVLVFQKLEQYDYAGAAVIGTVLLLVSLAMLLVINGLQQWGRRYAVKESR